MHNPGNSGINLKARDVGTPIKSSPITCTLEKTRLASFAHLAKILDRLTNIRDVALLVMPSIVFMAGLGM